MNDRQHTTKLKLFIAALWLGCIFSSPTSHAIALAQNFTFEGVLLDSTNSPIAGPVTLKFQIYAPNGTCVLFEETHTGVNPGSEGDFILRVGGGARASAGVDGGLLWKSIFQNDVAMTGGGPCNYTPAAGDGRLLRVTVGGVVLTPDFPIGPVPMATVAESLQGKTATDFIGTAGEQSLSGFLRLSNQNELRFSGSTANYVALKAPSTVPASLTWTLPANEGASGQVLSTNGAGLLSWITAGGGGGTVTSVSASAPLQVTNGTTTPILTLATSGVTAVHLANDAVTSAAITDGTIANIDISGSAAIATSKLSGPITSIAGNGLANSATIPANSTNMPSTLVQRDGTGNFVASAATLSGVTTGSLIVNSGPVSMINSFGEFAMDSSPVRILGNNGLLFQTQTSGPIEFETNGISRVWIHGSSGNVGIGTPSPTSPLHVMGGVINAGGGLVVGGGQPISKIAYVSQALAWSPSDSPGAGSGAAATFSITSIPVGTPLTCTPMATMPTSVFWNCYVSAVGTVEIRAHNLSGGVVTLPVNWRITEIKF